MSRSTKVREISFRAWSRPKQVIQSQAISIGNPLVYLVGLGMLSLRKNYNWSSLSWTATVSANFISYVRLDGTILLKILINPVA